MSSLRSAAPRLVEAGVLTPEQADLVLRQQAHLERYARQRKTVGEIAVEYGFATDAQVSQALATDQVEVHLRPVELPAHLLRQFEIKVLGVSDGVLQVAPLTPLTAFERAELLDACSSLDSIVERVEEVPVDAGEILTYLQQLASDSQALARAVDRFNTDPEDGTVAAVLEGLLNEAVQEKASDIHVVRDTNILNCVVSYRVDGVLRVRHLLTPDSTKVLSTRIKNDAGMDYAKTRTPQDGRISWAVNRRSVDIRVASIPTATGEKLVLRLLDPANRRSLESQLRDHPEVLSRVVPYTRIQGKSEGLILVTGPTGSGKSSFLYGLISQMNRLSMAINTAEDPVEQLIPLAAQTMVNPHVGLDFASVLRAQMRADPDALLVGEIRDRQTAEAALRSAESGHFVASTLHSTSCEDSVHRLLNLMDPMYRAVWELSVSSYLQMVLNLRLAPRLCRCAQPVRAGAVLNRSSLVKLRLTEDSSVLKPVGCARCRNTGFIGRVLVPEALFIPSEPKVRREMLRVLNGKESAARGLTDVEGIEFFSREGCLRSLMDVGQVDARTAGQLLGDFS